MDVVRDLSAAQAVEKVARGAAQDQTAPEHGEHRGSPRQQHPEHDHDGDGAPDEENHLASTEDAEGPAVVLYVGEAEEVRYEGDALPHPHRAFDDGLYSLVNDEDREREREGEEQAGPSGHNEAGCISGPLIGGIDPSISRFSGGEPDCRRALDVWREAR